jgi:cell wall-associated NlpC family hydrolase
VVTNDPGAPSATGAAAGVDPGILPGGLDRPGRALDGRAIAQFAMGFRGVPYRLGGADPTGFDCSGLVHYVFAQYGIAVPRIVEQQYELGDKVKPRDIKPGDLIFFDTKRWGGGASHVGISIGGDSFVHAPNSSGVVRVETLSSNYWGSRYVGARRVTSTTITN